MAVPPKWASKVGLKAGLQVDAAFSRLILRQPSMTDRNGICPCFRDFGRYVHGPWLIISFM